MKKYLILTTALLASMSLFACGGEKTDTVQRQQKETNGKAQVVEDFLGKMNGEEPKDPMKGDNQAVIKIGTAEELAELRDRVNAGEQALDVVLTAGIDLSSVCGEGIGNWIPIDSYNGVFDGAGHVISGLYMAGDEDGDAGLFGTVGYTGIVKNLGIVDCYLESSSEASALTINNQGVIENCYSNGVIKGYNASGLIGACAAESKVTGCYNLGAVEGVKAAGGVLCGVYDAEVSGCYNQGTVTASDAQGAASGVMLTVHGSKVTDCYNTGEVTAVWDAGGVAEKVEDGSIMTNCYNTGVVTASDAGGVANAVEESSLNRCYNTGAVKGEFLAAGVASTSGEPNRKSVIANCFNRGEVSAVEYARGVNEGTNCVTINCYNLGGVFSQNQGIAGAAGVAGPALRSGKNEQMMYNCYGAGPMSENSGGLIYGNVMTEMASVFYQEDTAAGYFVDRGSDSQDTTYAVSKEQLTGGEVLGQLNAYADSFSGLPEGCAETGELALDKWKTGADGYPVLEWEN